jgi:hypothetical protein
MNRPTRRPSFLLVPLALLLGPIGCGDDHDHDHDHEHEHDHAEHVDPGHWPTDLPDAVARLIEGHEQTRQALSAGVSGEALDALLHVQRDLAKWLPEVAADSDMPEGPWDRVDALASRLLPVYESAIADFDAGLPLGGGHLAGAEPALEDLGLLISEADPAWFPRKPAFDPAVEEELASDEDEGGAEG